MEIYTIGFTQKNAATFFAALKEHKIRRLIDVRINNVSQLAGYSKRDDLEFFLGELLGIEYLHEPMLAPTQELLKQYRDRVIDWNTYEDSFLNLLKTRRIETMFAPALFEPTSVLLCSEPTQERCHRRLVIEYLNSKWGNVKALPI